MRRVRLWEGMGGGCVSLLPFSGKVAVPPNLFLSLAKKPSESGLWLC
jgi:hypothetical protein